MRTLRSHSHQTVFFDFSSFPAPLGICFRRVARILIDHEAIADFFERNASNDIQIPKIHIRKKKRKAQEAVV
jgi:hypothetical protein